MDIKFLYNNYQDYQEKVITIIARVRSNRQGKAISFMILNDGTILQDLHVVYKNNIVSYEEGIKARIGSIVEINGRLVITSNRTQSFEIIATKIYLLDQAIKEYPLQKKKHSLEFLREITHLRARTKTFQAIFKVRSVASYAIHKYFQENNYINVNTPIITSNDAEGAGEQFIITVNENQNYENDFFGKKAVLTVSGQLNGEAFAQAFRKIYTFGPTFRAENSYTSRHAAEFWMIEPEIAFADLNANIILMQEMLKSIIGYVLKECKLELSFLQQSEPKLIERIKGLINANFKVNTYKEILEILKLAIANGHHFKENNIKFGLDLSTEHERYICEVVNKCPTFVINYPKEIKAFYMKLNDDNKTVAAVDLLVPGIGELCGGSEREGDVEKIKIRCLEHGINLNELDWYINLRKYGYYKSAGFGLGFERLIMYITGVANIRDVIPYPRTPKSLLY